jgi:Fuc2NAc and GlcNAc transferase
MYAGAVLCVLAFIAAAAVTPLVRDFVAARGLLDIPNQRSSHTRATPRGGGIGIVASVTVALVVLALMGGLQRGLFLALVVGGGAVAAVGFLDDRQKVSARWRLIVHTLAALWAVYWVGGLGTVRVGDHLALPGFAGTALAVLGVVWVLNLFNFMDGIDGIAAGEAMFVTAAGGLLALSAGNGNIAVVAWIFASACAGFLSWNWPPARVFLGDVGSGYLGYVVIVLALADTQARAGAIWEWFILGAVFFVDSTLTLLRRLFRGDRVHEAHRQHAYQRLARRWGSHLPVTVLVLVVNLLWLLPWAVWAVSRPSRAVLAAVAAALPVLLGCWLLGAGQRRE